MGRVRRRGLFRPRACFLPRDVRRGADRGGDQVVFGLLVAWVLARYDFPVKRLFGALVDLPFALPTAVAGIALTALYADTGLIGRHARGSSGCPSPTTRRVSSLR